MSDVCPPVCTASHNLRVREVEVRLGTRAARVVPTVDGEGCGFRVGVLFDHERRRQIRLAWVLIQVSGNPEHIPVSRGGRVGESLVQSEQVRRRDLLERLDKECLNSPRICRSLGCSFVRRENVKP